MADWEEYWIHGALGDDFNQGIVWLRGQGCWFDRLRGLRRIVRIRSCIDGSKPVYCEALWADAPYLEQWIGNLEKRTKLLSRAPMADDRKAARDMADLQRRLQASQQALWLYRTGEKTTPPVVFISQWHRRRLGIKPSLGEDDRHRLEISIGEPWFVWRQFLAGVEHPQIVVFLASVLAIVGLGVGVMGIGLALIVAPAPPRGILWWLGVVFILAGLVVFALGLLAVVRRQRVAR